GRDARGLVQVVDVLCHEAGRFAGVLERGERPVATPRLSLGERLIHRKAAPPGLVARLLACLEFIERDWCVFGPKSAGRTKVGNPAFGRDPGTGERHDAARLVEKLAERGARFLDILRQHACGPILWLRRGYGAPSRNEVSMRYLHTMLRV